MKTLLQISIFVFLLFASSNGIAQNVSEEQSGGVTKFIELVKSNDWASLSERIIYPLHREYPVASIENKTEFLERRNELFDDSLISMVGNSTVDSNWRSVGSRGIMLNRGDIWLDTDGNLIGLNYQTAAENAMENRLIEEDRSSLPVSLQEYERPILQMDADKFIIRIDQVKGQSYRFIGWIQGNRNPNRPAVEIIPNGFLEHLGSGGNHSYTFTSDLGTFVCFVNETGEEGTPPGELVLYRDGELIRSYPAIWLKN